MKQKAGSVIVPLITPAKSDDFFPLIDHVINGGVQDLVLFGTTGEGLKIDQETKKAIIKKVTPFVGDRARLYVGLLSANLPDALDLANFATGFGFFAGLLPPMIYGNDAQMVISQFISKTKTPLFLYNPPPFIGTIIPDIAPFVGHEQILGIKDSPSAYDVLERLVKRFRSPSFYVYTGREDHLETAFQIDLDGLVSGSANVFPELFMRVWKQRDSASLEELKRSKQYLAQLHPGDYIQCLKMELQKRRIIQ